jgi:hypothetical protein
MRKTPILLALAAMMAVPAVGFAQSPEALANNATAREMYTASQRYGRLTTAVSSQRIVSNQELWAAEMRARKAAKQAAREAEAAKAAAKID